MNKLKYLFFIVILFYAIPSWSEYPPTMLDLKWDSHPAATEYKLEASATGGWSRTFYMGLNRSQMVDIEYGKSYSFTLWGKIEGVYEILRKVSFGVGPTADLTF